MPATSITLLPTITNGTPNSNYNYDGSSASWATPRSRADGFYGFTDGVHTVAYFVNSFAGSLVVQASLATVPTEDDWFDLSGTTLGDGSSLLTTGVSYNFTGNFVWVRLMVRDFTAGSIIKVQYNY